MQTSSPKQLPNLEEIQQELARRSYIKYVKYVHEGRWMSSPHLEYVIDHVERLLNDEFDRLIIQMPPQHGKSQSVTETLPSYYLGKNPNNRVIEISYNDELAFTFGRRNKQKIERFGKELFNVQLARDSKSSTEFDLEGKRGGMVSRGVGGSITGRPGDLIIIDDPIKNRQEADSETYRNRLWDEWLNTIQTRLSARGKVILIMTRWHEDDLVGRLLANEPDKWVIINLPCEAESGDPLGRAIGDPLFPGIGKDKEWLQTMKTSYISTEGKRAWLALFQGRPRTEEGDTFKRHWWKYWHHKGQDAPPVAVKVGDTVYHVESIELPDRFDEQIQSWDCAFKDSKNNDYVCGQAWARKLANKFLLDQIKDHFDIIGTMEAIVTLTKRFPRATLKLVEDKANGPAVMQMLRNKIGGLVPVNPEGGKEARASAVAPEVESGNVYLPHPMNAPWVNDFINTCAAFPKVKYDDEVDAMSQALNRLQYRFIPGAKEEQGGGFRTPSEKEDLKKKNGASKYEIRRAK